MKERPILFSSPMVLALLAGKKTQTRRVIRDDWWRCLDPDDDDDRERALAMCPFGVAGDRLWVREGIRLATGTESIGIPHDAAVFIADSALTELDTWPWKREVLPGIFMPRGLCRIELEVIGVRIERISAISEADAKAEGVTPFIHDPEGDCWTAREDVHRSAFEYLWGEINGWRGPKSFSADPWVWAVEFRRIEVA